MAKNLRHAQQCRREPLGNGPGFVTDGAQPTGKRIADVDRAAAFVPPRHVTHPGGDAERKAGDRSAGSETVADRPEETLRQLLGAVHRNLPGSVPKRGIGEARKQRPLVGIEVGARRDSERRRDLLVHQAPDKAAKAGSAIAAAMVSCPAR